MKTLTQEVKGKDLPEQWRKEADIDSEEIVVVTIQPRRDELTEQLLAIAEEASAEAKEKGLTEERLSQLLHEQE